MYTFCTDFVLTYWYFFEFPLCTLNTKNLVKKTFYQNQLPPSVHTYIREYEILLYCNRIIIPCIIISVHVINQTHSSEICYFNFYSISPYYFC